MENLELFTVWSLIQVVSCVVIATCLLIHRRGAAKHCTVTGWVAWCAVVSCVAIVVKLLCDARPPVGAAEAMLTLITAIVVASMRGNLALLFHTISGWVSRRKGRLP